ncbi:MAG: hypothetical protein AB4060_01165 [Crocosphaera sp.]
MFTKAQVFKILCLAIEDIIEWAIDLLNLGYDSPNLRINIDIIIREKAEKWLEKYS